VVLVLVPVVTGSALLAAIYASTVSQKMQNRPKDDEMYYRQALVAYES